MSKKSFSALALTFSLVANTLATFLLCVSMGINSVIIPFFMETSEDFSEFATSVILSAEFAAALIFCLYSPKIIKKMGILSCFIVSTVCRALPLYFLTTHQTPMAWFLLSLVMGVGNFAGLLVLQTWINSMPRVKFTGLMTACYGTAISVGVAAAPFCLSLMGLSDTPLDLSLCAFPLKVSAGITLLALVPVLISSGFLPSIETKKTEKIFTVIKDNLPIMLAIVVCGASFYGTSTYIVIYGMRNNLSMFDASLLLSAFMLGSLFLESPLAWLTDFFNRRLMVVIFIFACILAAVCLPFSIYTPWYARILLFIWGGITGAIFSSSLAMTGDKFEEGDQVTANSAISLMENVGAFTATLIIGFTMKHMGTDGLPYTIMIFCMAYITYAVTRFRVS
jgi:MFS family permease